MEGDRPVTGDSQRLQVLEDMLVLAREKQEALVLGKLDRLDRVIAAEPALLLKMHSLEDAVPKMPAGEDESAKNRTLREQVVEVAEQLKEQNRLNRRLIDQGLAFLEKLQEQVPASRRDFLDRQA